VIDSEDTPIYKNANSVRKTFTKQRRSIMKELTIGANVTPNPEKGIEEGFASVQIQFPETVNEAVDNLGEDVVYSLLKQEVVKRAQSAIRALIKSGKSAPEIQASLESWRPGLGRPKMSKVDKAIKLTSGMSDEELKALLDSVKSRR